MRNVTPAWLWVVVAVGVGFTAPGCAGGPADNGDGINRNGSSGNQSTTAQPNPLRRMARPDLEEGRAVEDASTSNPPDSSSNPGQHLPEVVPYFQGSGVMWNDWVRGGPGVLDAWDMPCQPELVDNMDGCTHGGEARTVLFPNVPGGCESVVLEDALGAFDWACKEENGGVRAISTGLQDSPVRRGLTDLIAYTTPPQWRANRVLVRGLEGQVLAHSAWSVWWRNAVVEDNDGWEFGAQPNAVRVVMRPDQQQIPFVMVDHQALVIKPDTPLRAVGPRFLVGNSTQDGGVKFFWVEGPMTLRTYPTEGRIAINLQDARFVTLRNVSVEGFPNRHPAASIAVVATQTEFIRVQGLRVDGAAVAMQYQGYLPRDVRVEDVNLRNVGDGLVLLNAIGLRLRNINVTAPCSSGINLTGITNLEATNLSVVGCLNEAVSLTAVRGGHIRGVRVLNNSVGLHLGEIVGLTIQDVMAVNQTQNGVWASNMTNTVMSQVVAANNAGHGVLLSGGQSNVLFNITAANNGTRPDHSGIQVTTSNHVTLLGVAALNNAGHGVSISGGQTFSEGTLLGNSLLANNGRTGLNLLGSSHLQTTGVVRMGLNDGGDCGYDPGVSNALVPQGTQCVTTPLAVGTTLQADRNGSGALLGPLMVPDALRAGYHLFPEREGVYELIQDFVTFDRPLRAFAITANAPFGGSSQRGHCAQGHACQIHDYRARAGRAAAALQPEPTLSNVVIHPWHAMTQSACAAISGASWDGADCTTMLLPGAVELDDQRAGNHNALCESGERCRHTPNAGAYQGEGLPLIPWDAAPGPTPVAWGVSLTRASTPAVP